MSNNIDRNFFLGRWVAIIAANANKLRMWQNKLIWMIFSLCMSNMLMAANPFGDLRIEALNAPNFVVDSNIETPATYGPKAVHLGAHFCNDGVNDLTDVVVNIGDFLGSPAASTPGTYPVETIDEVANGWLYSGDFSFTHGTTNLSEATRLIDTIPAGECITQYWMITYPQLDAGGNAVFGANTVFADDLVLDYDFWASADDAGTPLIADQTYSATMRRELSAAANKIWPNTTSKVPDEYLDAIAGVLGWRPETGSESTVAGGIGTVSGIWYDFGVVNQGFDNDGDLVPDYNAWAQPVGDPDIFDSGCFKLVKTFGILIIKLNDGTDVFQPFVDELYFSNIPSNNRGMVGLVFYDFQALDGTCSIQISPYQEVASGSNNEKFNGDYGTFTGIITSATPEVTFEKTANKSTVALGSTITYDLIADNSAGTIAVGDASVGSPLVFHDAIPTGTQYLSGSAAAGNTLPAGVNVNVLYSTDDGTTWSTTEPALATDTTDLQWWLDAPLAIGSIATVTFTTTVPVSYPDLFVKNDASLGFGSSNSFAFDDVTVFIEGTLSISGTVYHDDGNPSGIIADGILNIGEVGHGSVTVILCIDANGDGIRDLLNDTILATTVTAADGTYSFTNLPDGYYIVEVETTDPDLFTGATAGWGLTNLQIQTAVLAGVSVTGIDFGIAPALVINKALVETSPVGEDSLINYTIEVKNVLKDTSGVDGAGQCVYDHFASNVRTADVKIDDPLFAVATDGGGNTLELDGAVATFAGGGDGTLSVDTFDIFAKPESIQKVELVYYAQDTGVAWVDDNMDFKLFDGSTATELAFGQLTTAQMNSVLTFGTNTQLILDVTNVTVWDWGTAAMDDYYTVIKENKVSNADVANLLIDAVSLRITTDCGGGSGTFDINKTLSPVPLTDSFDATYLQYVSSNPVADSFDNVTGSIVWNDVGPLNPNTSRTIEVVFMTQLPGGVAQVGVVNTAFSNTTTFANGLSANTATDTALVDIDLRLKISGTIWNDLLGSVAGWSGAIGYEGADTFVPRVELNLYQCQDVTTGGIAIISNASQPCESVQNDGVWTVIQTTTSDSNGDYMFTGLEQAYYYVEVDSTTLPGTPTQIGDPDETTGVCATCDDIWQDPTADISLLTETTVNMTEINFGYDVNAALFGMIFEDKDGDGNQDPGELPLVGWEVHFVDANGTLIVFTDANGEFVFVDLVANLPCDIQIFPPTPGDGTTWNQTLDPDGTLDNSHLVVPPPGEFSGSHDFAYQHLGSSTIGDIVFIDWDGNGVQDNPPDVGLEGVSVKLFEDINGDGIIDVTLDPFVQSTSSTGTYLFTNLPAGSYFVVVDESTLPAAFSQSSDPNEVGTCLVCDARDFVTVDGSNSYLLADFGYVPSGLGSIGDQVFIDTNGDGVLDPGESGIANIGVTLEVDINNNGNYVTIFTTTTDVDGLYSFDNLPDANYRVVVDNVDADLPNDT
ncbi:MAG: hypothetical protein JKY19_03890, partial [Alcanivoracaceae bacterium]|nr:hypothetical protein [Alcanivoracaceae bacterium]